MAENSLDQHIGANLQLHRILLGLDRETCATQLGVSPERLRNWESGWTPIGPQDVWSIKLYLDLDPSDLFAGMTA